MNLQGKTVNFIGDSITEGHGVADVASGRYDNILKVQCDLKTVYNYGIGGSRLAHQRVASENPRHDLYFCARAYDLNPAADLTVVFGGTNDYGHGDAPFGTMADKTPDTYCGAVDFLMRTLPALYPGMAFVFMTPARRVGDEIPNKSNALPLKAYVEVIRAKGAEYGIPVLDLYDDLGLDPNDEQVQAQYAPDGLHFNDTGHQIIADRLSAFLNAL